VKEIYGNQNNSTCIFHINKNLANLQQDGKTYVQLLETLEDMTSLASLSSKYEDLHIKILMNPDFQSLTSVCATIQ